MLRLLVTEKFPESEIAFTGRVETMKNTLCDEAAKPDAIALRSQGTFGNPTDTLLVCCWKRANCGREYFSVLSLSRRVVCRCA